MDQTALPAGHGLCSLARSASGLSPSYPGYPVASARNELHLLQCAFDYAVVQPAEPALRGGAAKSRRSQPY